MLKKILVIALAFAGLIAAGGHASAGPDVAAKFTAGTPRAVQPVFHGPGGRFHGGFRGHGAWHGHRGWHGHNAWRGHHGYGRHYGYRHHYRYGGHYKYSRYRGYRYYYGGYYGGGSCYSNCREHHGAGYCESYCD